MATTQQADRTKRAQSRCNHLWGKDNKTVNHVKDQTAVKNDKCSKCGVVTS